MEDFDLSDLGRVESMGYIRGCSPQTLAKGFSTLWNPIY